MSGKGALLLALGFILSTCPASAQGANTGQSWTLYTSVNGIVTSGSRGILTVVTPSGSVSVRLTRTTRVTEVLTGSIADLTPNQWVELWLAPRTATVKAARVGLVDRARYSTTSCPRPSRSSQPPSGIPRESRERGTHVAGRITGVAVHSITVSDQDGHTATYAIDDGTGITKFVAGRRANLAIGEMVLVCTIRTRNVATAITILSL